MDENRFYDLFYFVFRFGGTEEYPEDKIARLRAILQGGKWPSNRVTSIFYSFYSDLDDSHRELFPDFPKRLDELRVNESDQRDELVSNLDSILSDVSLDRIRARDRFIRHVLAERNSEVRSEIVVDLLEGLDKLEAEYQDSNYDITNLEEAYEYGSEDDVYRELSQCYCHLRNKGWHHRDLSNLPTMAIHLEESIEVLRRNLKKDATEYTMVYFVSNIEPTEIFQPDNLVEWVIPKGELSIEDLADYYPYGEGEFEYVKPDIPEYLEERAVIILKVEAYLSYAADELGLEKLSTFYDTYSTASTLTGVEDPQYTGNLPYLRWPEHGEKVATGGEIHESWPPIFDDRIAEEMTSLLSALEEGSTLEPIFHRGIHLFRKGNISPRDVDTLVYYFACLETIAGTSDAGKEELMEVMITLGKLWDTDANRDLLEEVVEARNYALHSGVRHSSTKGETELMRHGLKSALFELANCIRETDSTTIEEFIEYVDDKVSDMWRTEVDELRAAGLEPNEEYEFSSTVIVEEDEERDQERVEVTFSGTAIFEYRDGRLIPKMGFEEAEKAGEGRFPNALNPEIELEFDDATIVIELVRIPVSVGNALTTDTFEFIAPWEAIPLRFEATDGPTQDVWEF